MLGYSSLDSPKMLRKSFRGTRPLSLPARTRPKGPRSRWVGLPAVARLGGHRLRGDSGPGTTQGSASSKGSRVRNRTAPFGACGESGPLRARSISLLGAIWLPRVGEPYRSTGRAVTAEKGSRRACTAHHRPEGAAPTHSTLPIPFVNITNSCWHSGRAPQRANRWIAPIDELS